MSNLEDKQEKGGDELAPFATTSDRIKIESHCSSVENYFFSSAATLFGTECGLLFHPLLTPTSSLEVYRSGRTTKEKTQGFCVQK